MESLTRCPVPTCQHAFFGSKPRFCPACGLPLPDAPLPAGHCHVGELLGVGGFGVTYTAVDITTGHERVVKILHNRSTKAVELFQREATILTQVAHPGLPRYVMAFEAHGYPCLLMDKIAGKTLLGELTTRHRPFSEAELLPVMRELAGILETVHAAGVVHRDIKPENLIRRARVLPGQTTIVLIDLGVASVRPSSTSVSSGTVTGTNGYAPPEQMRGYALPQSDLYAVGTTMIHLLTGKHPAAPELFDVHSGKFVWREMAASAVSDGMERLIGKLTAMTPTERLQGARELKEALDQVGTPSSGGQGRAEAVALQEGQAAQNAADAVVFERYHNVVKQGDAEALSRMARAWRRAIWVQFIKNMVGRGSGTLPTERN